jgi:hypothetical protein
LSQDRVDRNHLNGLGIKFQTLFLVGEELLDILALISLKLNHLSHLSINDDGAIASYCWSVANTDERGRGAKTWTKRTELLLNDLENFLLVEFLGKTLDSRQSLTTIALYDINGVSPRISSSGVRRGAVPLPTEARDLKR